jgi:hypothetical protein|eukprot:COSAG06_NODE_2173_length_7416_cov_3.697827_4_plen_40_part_00
MDFVLLDAPGMKLKLLSTAVVGVGLLVGSGGAAEGEAAR